MKVNGVHALVTLLAQQTALRGNASDRGIKLQVLNDLLTETKDARQRLVVLERMLRDANIIGTSGSVLDTTHILDGRKAPDLAHWRAASATLDAINKQQTQISGRTWDGAEGEVRPQGPSRPEVVPDETSTDDGLRTQVPPQQASSPGPSTINPNANPYAASAAIFGVAEKFEPTLEDIEKALHTLGVPPLDPVLRRHIENDLNDERTAMLTDKFRFLLVAAGMAVLFSVVLMLAN